MKNWTKRLLLAVTMLLLSIVLPVNAKVYTREALPEYDGSICVAGNDNFYPIEYYNKEKGEYDGVLPRLLADISLYTGIDFTYIRNGSTQAQLVANDQVEMISAYITDSELSYVTESVQLFSCVYDGKTINIGWGFTENAEEEHIKIMREAIDSITEAEINGYFMLSSMTRRIYTEQFLYLTIFYAALLLAVILLGVFRIKAINRQLHKNRRTDPDTEIGNLLHFEYCFNNIITDSVRYRYYIAYIVIDSNYLQVYHGKSTFKDSVRYTAGVLNSAVSEGAFVARIAENSFAMAFQAYNRERAEAAIQEVMYQLDSYLENDDKKSYYCVAVCNLNRSDRNCEYLLFNLRKYCDRIINTNRQYIYCDEAMINSAEEEKKLMESILQGFRQNEFKLYLQFVVDNKTKQFVSAEALSRWDNPRLGLVYPGKYIEAMENSGNISSLDYYMFDMCCCQLHKWKDTELDNLSISCNFTRITLSETDFIDNILEISKKYIFDKSKLVIEITEDSMEKNVDRATENVRACKEFGFKIALDDLGSGNTSLKNLCEYPIDIVKIDRDILLKINTAHGKNLFEGIIALAHSLGLKVICEGVETEEQKRLVDATECDMVQGWYYSQVLPSKDGEEFAKQHLSKQ